MRPGGKPKRHRSAAVETAIALALIATVLSSCADSNGSPDVPISEARAELLTAIGNVAAADGYRYQVTDDRGVAMGPMKVIQIGETDEYAAVYHYSTDAAGPFTTALATSSNLLDWTWRVDLGQDASQPTIQEASDAGYVTAWEVGIADDIHVRLDYYPTLQDLLGATPSKTFEAERQLPGCAEGTPSIYAASSREVEFGLHFFANCEADRQARGTTDWVTWEAEEQPLLDRAVLFQGYRGSVGDRDVIRFQGHDFTFLEGQFTPGDWGSFRVLEYDDETGAADRASYPDPPAEPPSEHVFIYTHRGSESFSNFTVSEVEFEGHRAIVVGLFIQQGAPNEAGQLIYYRILDD